MGPIAKGFAKPNADRYEWDEAELRSKINGAELRLYAIDRYGREVDVTK